MSKLQKCDKPKIGQKISTRGPPTEISDESMIFGIIHRLVKIFGRRPSSRDFLAYFWFVAFLEFGHVGHKGLKSIMRTSQNTDKYMWTSCQSQTQLLTLQLKLQFSKLAKNGKTTHITQVNGKLYLNSARTWFSRKIDILDQLELRKIWRESQEISGVLQRFLKIWNIRKIF